MGAGMQLALPLAAPAVPVRRARGGGQIRTAVYEAGAHNARTLRWRAPTTSPNQGIYNLTTLRDRSRAACRNDGYAGGSIDKLVVNIVGTGIKPLSAAATPEFRKAVQAAWLRWTNESDADGLLDWYGQQAQAVRAWLEGGEAFLRLRQRQPGDGLTVPLQVQVIEPELCPHDYNGQRGGNRIRAGIEFSPIGKRVAYYFYNQRPGALEDFDVSDLRRVPAESVVHLYNPTRPGQLRGIPHLTRALVRLFEVEKYENAALLRSQIANLFAGFVTRPQGAEDVNPFNGQVNTTFDNDDRPVVGLEPGIMQELDPGEKVEFNDPPSADPFGPAFMKQQLMGVAAATGVPYEVLTGDMAGLSDRVMRVVLHEFRRSITATQHHIVAFQLCGPVWRAWMDRALLAGALQIPAAAYAVDAEPWQAVKWMPQGWPYLHPVQDVDAAQRAIKAGFASRSGVVSEQGEDSEVIDLEQKLDNERAADYGLRYESGTAASAAPTPPASGAGQGAAA